MSTRVEAVRAPDAGTGDLLRVLHAVLKGCVVDDRPVDWSWTLPLARRHQLDAFLFDAVAAWPSGCGPSPDILANWTRMQRVRAVEAVRSWEQRATLLAALKSAGVSVIPLKGAWLAEQVYADIVQRPMSDIDLLILPGQLDTARHAMATIGYSPVNETRPGDWGKEQLFRHPEWRCSVELQWQLWHPTHEMLPHQDMAHLWASATPSTLAGVEVPVLPPAKHLIYLVYHMLAHRLRFPARAHLDLVLLGRRYAQFLTVDALAAEARAWGLGFRAPFVWRVAHDLCGVEPPSALAGWVPGNDGWMRAERRVALDLALPDARNLMTMTPLLAEFRQAPWWRRAALGYKAIRVPPAMIRQTYPVCTRWGGLAGGYSARVADLARRRMCDVLPSGRRRASMAGAEDDMSARLQLERWLKSQEKHVLPP